MKSKKSKNYKSKPQDDGQDKLPEMPSSNPLPATMPPALTSAGAVHTPIILSEEDSDDMESYRGRVLTPFELNAKQVSIYLSDNFAIGSGNPTRETRAALIDRTTRAIIAEITRPEFCFPSHGVLPNVGAEAQDWYRSVRVVIAHAIDELNLADGKYKETVHATYPLRHALNQIMIADTLEHCEAGEIARFSRIYARAQGDAQDGVDINKTYLKASGLEKFPMVLTAIFKAEHARRLRAALPDAEVVQSVHDTIARLECKGASKGT